MPAVMARIRAAVPHGQMLDLVVIATLGSGIIMLVLYLSRWEWIYKHPYGFTAAFMGQLLLYLLAAIWILRRRPAGRWVFALIILIALGARLAFAVQPPNISDDIYRYVWDGRVQSELINPYRYPPNDPAFQYLRDDAIYEEVNRKPVRTIYPPVAQTVFRFVYLLHPDSVAWTKLAFIGFDLATILILAGLLPRLGMRPERVLLYAWHPLLILELGHSGHVDVVAICFLALALWARLAERPRWTGMLLACATLVKFYAVVALPALLFRSVRKDLQVGGVLSLSIALAYLPFLGVGTHVFGYLSGYVNEEGISSGTRFYVLEQIQRVVKRVPHLPELLGLVPLEPARAFQIGLFLAMLGLALWCWLAKRTSPTDVMLRMALLFAALLVLATPTYPWYWLLALLPLPFLTGRWLIAMCTIVSSAAFLYLQWWWPGAPDRPRDLVYGGGIITLTVLALVSAVTRVRSSNRQPPEPSDRVGVLNGTRSAATIGVTRASPAWDESAQGRGSSPSLFDRFPWLYACCCEYLFRDHTRLIVRTLWPGGDPAPRTRLLEIGCGPGVYARRLAARYTSVSALGIDRSLAQLERARARAAMEQLRNCRFEYGDALGLLHNTATIDAVVVSRLFTVVPERERVLAEVHRVLRDGGNCFVAEPRLHLWSAVPLQLLWLTARISAAIHRQPLNFREPRGATVLSVDQFVTLITSQVWHDTQIWHDRHYHYAVCSKGTTTGTVGTVGTAEMTAEWAAD